MTNLLATTQMQSTTIIREYDVVCLKAPMQVFASLPEKFLDPDKPYSSRKVTRLVPVGSAIHNPAQIAAVRGKVQQEIEKLLEMPGLSYPADLVGRFVSYVLPDVAADSFMIPEGEYLVMRTNENADGDTEVIARKFDSDHFYERVVVRFLQGSDRPGSVNEVEVLRNLFDDTQA